VPLYLGQRYLPDADQARALAEADRIRRALRERKGRSAVRLLSTTLVPNEEWVFDLFEAESVKAVERAYRLGGVGFERVTEAVHVADST
jgi:hypothetical protein